MHIDTGHLVDLKDKTEEEKKQLQEAGYIEVPEELAADAQALLAGKAEVIVTEKEGTVGAWLAKKRAAKEARVMARRLGKNGGLTDHEQDKYKPDWKDKD